MRPLLIGLNRLVAADRPAGERKGIKVAFALGRLLRIVDGVVGNRRRDGAGYDAIQGAGPGKAAVLNGLKEQFRSVIECRDVGARESIRQPEAHERITLHRIAGERRKTCAVLVVILNELRIDADGLAEEQRFLFSLIETVTAGKNRKACGNRTVE